MTANYLFFATVGSDEVAPKESSIAPKRVISLALVWEELAVVAVVAGSAALFRDLLNSLVVGDDVNLPPIDDTGERILIDEAIFLFLEVPARRRSGGSSQSQRL